MSGTHKTIRGTAGNNTLIAAADRQFFSASAATTSSSPGSTIPVSMAETATIS